MLKLALSLVSLEGTNDWAT